MAPERGLIKGTPDAETDLVFLLLLAAVFSAGCLVLACTSRRTRPDAPSSWLGPSAGPVPDVLTLNVLVFEYARVPEQGRGLVSRIFDDTGAGVGVVVNSDGGIAVYDRNDRKLVGIYQESRKQPIKVIDADGWRVGAITPRDRRRRHFTMRTSVQIVGSMEFQRAKGRELAWVALLREPTGIPGGRLLYPRNRAAAGRLRGEEAAAPSGWRSWVDGAWGADAYVLEFVPSCPRDLRRLTVAAAAAIELVDFGNRRGND
jgi:hypothetical protein